MKELRIKTILFVSLFALAQPTYAQVDVNNATREIDRPIDKEIEEKLKTPPRRPPEIEDVEEEEVVGEQFFVKDIELLGCETFLPEEFGAIIERYEQREVTLQELKILTKQIEREYLRKGIVVACFLPPQDVREGKVILQVIEAKMGELRIEPHPYFKKERIAYYWDLYEGETLRYDRISRSLQIMNTNPDREVRATLHAGKKPGTTDVILTADTRFPIHLTASWDREGVASTGRYRRGVGLRHNNFLGFDDVFVGGYTSGKDFSSLYAYHRVPITKYGTYVLYGYSYSKSFPSKELEEFAVDSRSRVSTISLQQDLFRKETYIGEAHISFNAKDKVTKMNIGTTNKDRLRIVRLGGTYTHRGITSTTTVKPEISKGFDLFGARGENRLSSRGAHSAFSKMSFTLEHKRHLPHKLQLTGKLKTQFAYAALAPQEEFSMGGINSVRGYPAGDYLADTAVQTNLELLIPAFFIPQNLRLPYSKGSLKDDVTALVFFDYAWGERRNPTESEKDTATFLGIGPGLRIRLFDQVLMRLEWGFPMGNSPITEKSRSHFHFSVDFQDQVPEELARIKKLRLDENIKKWAWDIVNEAFKDQESVLGKRLYHYLFLAEEFQQKGDVDKAYEYYKKIYETGASVYNQTIDHIRGCLKHQKDLEEYDRFAQQYYNEGDFERAKEIWQTLLKEAKRESLELEIK